MRHFLILVSLLFSSVTFAQSSFVDDLGQTHGLGLNKEANPHGKLFFAPRPALSAPASLDFRQSGWVSKIKDQGSCGSCWSFAITKSLESARMRAGLGELDISEQEMVSCNKDAYGCGGGFMSSADYVVANGLSLESEYKYTGTDTKCKNPLPARADKFARWAYVGQPNRKPTVQELKDALNTYGTLFVTVSAGGTDWGGSKIHMTGCSNRQTNHMVTLVGYTESDEFIIGNSWGSSWAEAGFAYAKQGCNNLANEVEGAAFIVYEGGPAPLPPKVKLPSDIYTSADIKTPIGVEMEGGATYEWYAGSSRIGTGNLIWVQPKSDTVYKVSAKTSAGTAESTVLVHVGSTPPLPPNPDPIPLKQCWKTYDQFAFCIGTSNVAACLTRADQLKACVR